MIFQITVDNEVIYSSDLQYGDRICQSPKLEQQFNVADSLSFIKVGDIEINKKSIVRVLQDGVEIFRGRQKTSSMNFYKQTTIKCEGQLAFLGDSVQPQASYEDQSLPSVVTAMLAIHNEQVEDHKKFQLGLCEVNTFINFSTNYISTMEALQKLASERSGYLRFRKPASGEIYYLDFMSYNSGALATQKVTFGKNLLDFNKNKSISTVYSIIVPLGANMNEGAESGDEKRLTIASVNDGSDSLQNDTLVRTFGKIAKVKTYDDIESASELKSRALSDLNSQLTDITLEVKFLDLHWIDESIPTFSVGNQVQVISEPHDLNKNFILSKMSLEFDKPENSTITLGRSNSTSLSKSINSVSGTAIQALDKYVTRSAVTYQAQQMANHMFNIDGTGSFIQFDVNEDGIIEQIFAMDSTDASLANKKLVINKNGVGGSSDGGVNFATALTTDGWIYGGRIIAGSIEANSLSIDYKNSVEGEIISAKNGAINDAAEYTNTKLNNYYTISEITTKFDVIPGQISAAIADASEIFMNVSTQDKAYIESKLKNYWTKEDTQTAITAAVNQISASVEKKVDEISVGASNMLLHTDFSDWQFVNCNIVIVNDSSYGTCIKVTATGDEGTSYFRGKCVAQVAPYINGEYTLSIHAKSLMASGSELVGVLGFDSVTPLVDDDGLAIVTSVITNPEYEIYGKAYSENGKALSSEWTRPNWTFTGSEVSYTPKIYLMPDVTYVFAKPQYEIGNRMTAFTESSTEVEERYYTKDEVYSKTELMMDDNSFAVKVINTAKSYTDGQVSSDRTRLAALELTADGLSSRVTSTENNFSNYSTTSQMNTAIQNSADNLSAEISGKVDKVTYESYVTQTATTLSSKVTTTQMSTAINNKASDLTSDFNDKLSKYSTTAQMNSAITQSAESITTEVNKKVDKSTYNSYVKQTATTLSSKVETDDFGTLIEQNSSSVKISWNKISRYIQFENAQLNIYTYESNSYKKLISFNSGGMDIYHQSYNVGRIGTNHYSGDTSKRGIEFDLEYDGAYMAWSARYSSSQSHYIFKLLYVQKAFSSYKKDHIYLGCSLDTYGWDLKSNGHAGVTTSGTFYLPANTSFTSYYGPYKLRNGIICNG